MGMPLNPAGLYRLGDRVELDPRLHLSRMRLSATNQVATFTVTEVTASTVTLQGEIVFALDVPSEAPPTRADDDWPLQFVCWTRRTWWRPEMVEGFQCVRCGHTFPPVKSRDGERVGDSLRFVFTCPKCQTETTHHAELGPSQWSDD